MTKSNYQAIAKIIRHVLGNSTYFHPFVDTIVSYMKDENKLFNETKFRQACRNEDGGELKDKDGEARKDLTIEQAQNIIKSNEEINGPKEQEQQGGIFSQLRGRTTVA